MDTTRAATTHDQQTSPTPTRQMPQGGTYGRRQPEPVSESSPLLHRYFGNSYVQAMTATDGSGGQPALSASLLPSQSEVLQRQCACGNPATDGRCSACSQKQRLGLQTKLTVNEPGDIYEREADRVADQVMAAPTHSTISEAPPRIQRFSGQPHGQTDATPASVGEILASPGMPLEPALRQDMEQRFGHDFSRVRVHIGAAAEQSAQDVSAQAYTVGHDIVFGGGAFSPGTHQGRRLIAHELTHVVQQSGTEGGPVSHVVASPALQRKPDGKSPSEAADPIEEENFPAYAWHLVGATSTHGSPSAAVVRAIVAENTEIDRDLLAATTPKFSYRNYVKGGTIRPSYFSFRHPTRGIVARAFATLKGFHPAQKPDPKLLAKESHAYEVYVFSPHSDNDPGHYSFPMPLSSASPLPKRPAPDRPAPVAASAGGETASAQPSQTSEAQLEEHINNHPAWDWGNAGGKGTVEEYLEIEANTSSGDFQRTDLFMDWYSRGWAAIRKRPNPGQDLKTLALHLISNPVQRNEFLASVGLEGAGVSAPQLPPRALRGPLDLASMSDAEKQTEIDAIRVWQRRENLGSEVHNRLTEALTLLLAHMEKRRLLEESSARGSPPVTTETLRSGGGAKPGSQGVPFGQYANVDIDWMIQERKVDESTTDHFSRYLHRSQEISEADAQKLLEKGKIVKRGYLEPSVGPADRYVVWPEVLKLSSGEELVLEEWWLIRADPDKAERIRRTLISTQRGRIHGPLPGSDGGMQGYGQYGAGRMGVGKPGRIADVRSSWRPTSVDRVELRGKPPRLVKPTAPATSGPKPTPTKVSGGAPPTPVGSAGTATGSRIPPISRHDVTHGGPFPAPSAKPAVPAPVKPTPPSRLQRWLRSKILEYTMRGVDLSGVASKMGGAGGTAGVPRPTPALIDRTTPSRVAPTSAPLPRTPAPPPVVSPASGVTPSAPRPSTTTGRAVRRTAPVPPTPGVEAGVSARVAQINQWIDEETAHLSQPGSRPLDPHALAAHQLWEDALLPLAQQPNGGRIGVIDVGGVHFHDVEVSWNGAELQVGYFGIERVTAPPGAGVERQAALEQAAVQVAHQAGTHAVRVFARTVVNPQWRAILEGRGYRPYMMEHEFGFENVWARLFTIAQQTGATRMAPTPPGSIPPGSVPPGSTPFGSTPSGPTSSGPTQPRSASTVDLSTLSVRAPSHTAAGAVTPFTPPGPIRVLEAQDYNVTPLDEGANLGKRIVQHKVTGAKSLFKPASGEREIIGSEAGIVAGDRFRRAPAAAYLAREAGFTTPAAEIVIWKENGKEEIGSLQEWVEEGKAAAAFRGQPVYNTITRSQPKRDLDAFDYVIANMDRNVGNWKVVLDSQTNTVQKVIPIDMDSSLPPGPGRYSLGRVLPPYQQPMPATISRGLYDRLLQMRANWATIERELRAFLQQVEIDGVFTRLCEVLESVRTGNIDVVP